MKYDNRSGKLRGSRVNRTLGVMLACICALFIASTAGADEPPAEKEGKQFNFETDEVTVDVLKPDATAIEVMRAKARQSLIRIRLDFIKEIVRSAEDI